jgi:hypothetical protein
MCDSGEEKKEGETENEMKNDKKIERKILFSYTIASINTNTHAQTIAWNIFLLCNSVENKQQHKNVVFLSFRHIV